MENGERRVRTEGLWQKCDGCRQIIWKKDLEANWNVCPKCGRHFRIDAATRLQAAAGRRRVRNVRHRPALHRPAGLRRQASPTATSWLPCSSDTGLTDALISAAGKLDGRPVQMCAMEPRFIGGSMGSVVGEMIARAIERAIDAQHAADHRFRFRRHAHAGGRRQPDADGQDFGRADAPG